MRSPALIPQVARQNKGLPKNFRMHPFRSFLGMAKKYLFVFGTRPEAIKMAPVLQALKSDPQAKCVVCVTGQHQELLDSVLSLFHIKPDYHLRAMSHNQELCALTARLLTELEKVIALERPDWVLVQGDTT